MKKAITSKMKRIPRDEPIIIPIRSTYLLHKPNDFGKIVDLSFTQLFMRNKVFLYIKYLYLGYSKNPEIYELSQIIETFCFHILRHVNFHNLKLYPLIW